MKRIWTIVFALCALFSVGCDPRPAAEPQQTAAVQQNATPSAQNDIQAFWSEFRAAVKADNKEKIASLTAFPFQTTGQVDSDPVKKHNKESFLKILDRLLDADPGIGQENRMRLLIARKAEIDSKDRQGETRFSVGNFTFDKVSGRWAFTIAELPE